MNKGRIGELRKQTDIPLQWWTYENALIISSSLQLVMISLKINGSQDQLLHCNGSASMLM
jgi:hypothetical protein